MLTHPEGIASAIVETSSVVALSDVTFRYPGTEQPVLCAITLNVVRGESVCLWGPSGSGKSTLLALIGGVVQPTSGTVIRADGFDGFSPPAWVMQTANLFGSMTVRDNVALGALAAGMPLDVARSVATDLLTRMKMDTLSGRRAKQLSGGQAQRVAVARALVSRSGLVLADEPTGQLDAGSTEHVCDVLLGSMRGGNTVVVASHDQSVAERCDRIVRVANGAIA